jgi:hypothetical protein
LAGTSAACNFGGLFWSVYLLIDRRSLPARAGGDIADPYKQAIDFSDGRKLRSCGRSLD